jgi:hypothetical protein
VEGYLLGEDIYPSPNLRQENQMEKTIKYLLQEAYVDGYNDARESVAKEVEGFTMSWHQFSDGLPLHANCPNCNAKPYTPVCDASRDYFAKSVYQNISKIIRGDK